MSGTAEPLFGLQELAGEANADAAAVFVEPSSMFKFNLECPTSVRKTGNQNVPVVFLNRGQWYRVSCNLANRRLTERARAAFGESNIQIRLFLSFINRNLSQIAHMLYGKFASQHPDEPLIEVRMSNAGNNTSDQELTIFKSGTSSPNLLFFEIPYPQIPGPTGEMESSFEIRLNAVVSQFYYDMTANHPLMKPFDFGLAMISSIGTLDQTDFYPIRVTWPHRAEPLSAIVQSRYDQYQSLKRPVDVEPVHSPLPLPADFTLPSTMAYTLNQSAYVDPTDGKPITYLARGHPVTLTLKPLVRYPMAVFRTSISLAPHRSTARSSNHLVQHMAFSQRFSLLPLECSKLAEAVYDVYVDPMKNSVELIWIPAREVSLALVVDSMEEFDGEMAQAKMHLNVETARLIGSGQASEQASAVVKFRDPASPNPQISSTDGALLSTVTQLQLCSNSNRHRHHHHRSAGPSSSSSHRAHF